VSCRSIIEAEVKSLNGHHFPTSGCAATLHGKPLCWARTRTCKTEKLSPRFRGQCSALEMNIGYLQMQLQLSPVCRRPVHADGTLNGSNHVSEFNSALAVSQRRSVRCNFMYQLRSSKRPRSSRCSVLYHFIPLGQLNSVIIY
jgi:hypothetical protein